MKILPYIKVLRPIQWLKNLMLFFPPFLGGVIFQQQSIYLTYLPFFVFCIASSFVYIINDTIDCKADKQHPTKQFRPLPSGAISCVKALFIAAVLLVLSIYLAATISVKFLVFLLLYLLISVAYSLFLKNYPVFDIFCIASGFIFRLLAGGDAFKVIISEWLFLTVFLLALFLSTGKRYSEQKTLGDIACQHRIALKAYPAGFLDGVLFMTGSAVLVTYTMYVISRHSPLLLYSVPLSCFGLLRYILRVQSGKGGDPTESLTRDLPLLVVGITWIIMVGLGIYGR